LMIYPDTSVLIALFSEEAETSAVERWYRVEFGPLVISEWTVTEFFSAIGIKVRRKELSPAQGLATLEHFTETVTHSFRTVPVTPPDQRRAQAYLRRFEVGLRAGDALHLAVAANQAAKKIVSLDEQFVAAGKRLKLPAGTPSR
jgi:predicted nucleic acid-binding protein